MKDLRGAHFHEIRETLTGKRLDVYEAFTKRGPSTCSEIARFIGWDVTSVRPRATELRDAFHLTETGVRRDHEHEFRALTPAQAEAMHAVARREWLVETAEGRQERRQMDQVASVPAMEPVAAQVNDPAQIELALV